MSNVSCTLCKRNAVWTIQNTPLCEAHKEKVIRNFGIDRFPIRRMSTVDRDFFIRGRHKV